ncbi:MAG TPA: ankyrin repeat domain-containing protein [Phycisphaerae bacterium]|nr:ankyrin repeat domain-containing protein [Phycisphaerae bacterium]
MAGKIVTFVIGLVVVSATIALIYFSSMLLKGTEEKTSPQNSVPTLNRVDQAFIAALENADVAAASKALQAQPDLNLVDPANGYSSLLIVLKNIDEIILAGVQMNKSLQQELQFWQDLAGQIVAAGADVNGNGDWGHIPLEQADTPWTVEFLLQHHTKVDIDAYAGTPLYWHADDNYVEIEKLLLQAGANPNIRNFEGQTPLHKAASDESVRIIPLLLQYGADKDPRDDKGYTPLKLAEALHMYLTITMLQNDGATD